jgi:hypothetical protein
VRGFFLNPMNEAELNELPFVTAGDYFADPRRYDASRSYIRAASELGGPQASTLRAFGEVNFSDPFDPGREAPTFVARSDAFLAAYQVGGRWAVPAAALDLELALVRNAAGVLATRPALSYFVSEATPFLVSARTAARVGTDVTDLLASERPGLSVSRSQDTFAGRATPPDPNRAAAARSALASDDTAMLDDPHETYGYRVFVFDVPPVAAPPNKMDAFVDRARALDQTWLPVAQQAAAAVRVTLDGRPVALDGTGHFRLPATARGLLEAIDGAGGRTDITLPLPPGQATSPAGSRRCRATRHRHRARHPARKRPARGRDRHPGQHRTRGPRAHHRHRSRRRAAVRCNSGQVRSRSRRPRPHAGRAALR